MKFPLAPNGIFHSLQGEGAKTGQPMTFLRLAGCSVGCPGCDTDYSVSEKVTTADILKRMDEVTPDGAPRVAWVTGGEPADLPIAKQDALSCALRSEGWVLTVATSGSKPWRGNGYAWLSVSPHGGKLKQLHGGEIKVVHGLNGLDARAWIREWDDKIRFPHRFVQPLTSGGLPTNLDDCLAITRESPGWGLSEQHHHRWRLP